MRLQGKTALITGAARGIGLEFARAYIAEGATVALADVNAEALDRVVAELGAKSIPVVMDMTSQASIDAGFASAIAAMGHLDILINNAALFSAAPIMEITRADHDRLFAVNVVGTLFLPAGRRNTHDPARSRHDHQHGLTGWPAWRGPRRGLQCHQGCRDLADPVGGAGPHQAWHQRQRHRARRGGW